MIETTTGIHRTPDAAPRRPRLAAAVAGTTTALALAFSGAVGAVAEPGPQPAPYDPVRACVDSGGAPIPIAYEGATYLPVTVMSVDPLFETIDPSRIQVTVHPEAAPDQAATLSVDFWKEVGLADVHEIQRIVDQDPASEGRGVITVTVDGKVEARAGLDTRNQGDLTVYREIGCENYSSETRALVNPIFRMNAWKTGSVLPTPERFQENPEGDGTGWFVFMTRTKQESSRDGDLTGAESVTFDETGIEILRTESVGLDGTRYLQWVVVDVMDPEDWAAFPGAGEPPTLDQIRTWEPGDEEHDPGEDGPPCLGDPCEGEADDPAEPADPAPVEDDQPADPAPGDDAPADPQPADPAPEEKPADPAPEDESTGEDAGHTVPGKVDTGGAAAGGLALAGLTGAGVLVALRRRFGMG